MEEFLDLANSLDISAEQIDIPFTLLNFLISLIVSLVVRYFYVNYSTSLSGKLHIGSIIPILSFCGLFSNYNY